MATRKDNTRAAWDAATKSTTESTLGLIADTHETVTNGVNVEVRIPKVGDVVLADDNKKVRFIARDTFESLPDGWQKIGNVAVKHGRQLLVVNKTNASKKASEVFQWEISGAAMTDGAAHTGTLKIGSESYSFSWQTTSAESFAEVLHAFVQTNHPTDQPYSCYVDLDGAVLLQQDNYNTYAAVSLTGLTVSSHIWHELLMNSTCPKVAPSVGTSTSARANDWRAIEYWKTHGADLTGVPDIDADGTMVSLSDFKTNAYCDAIRQRFCTDPSNPTDDDYTTYCMYMLDNYHRIVNPSMSGAMGPDYRDGKTNTYKLAGATYKRASDGARVPKHPAIEYCVATGYEGVKGFEVGDWFMPALNALTDIIGPVTYPVPNSNAAKADALNRGLKRIGGPQIQNDSYIWASDRFNTNLAWFFNGNYGLVSGNVFCGSNLAVPVALYEIPEGDE